jgi:hypothetical protein
MKQHSFVFYTPRRIINVVLLFAVLVTPLSVIIPRWGYFTNPYYDDAAFHSYEHAFNTSQYRVKNPGIIPDETLFSYVSGAYLRGMDPILANSEHTPLGKYFIALSIYVLHNDRFPAVVFAFLMGVSIWLVGKQVFGNGTVALIPLLLVTLDRLFTNQLVTAPLLDIIQLPFIFFALAAFLKEQKSGRYVLTALSIGAVIATKTVVPGILLAGCMGIFLLLNRDTRGVVRFCLWLPLSFLVLLMSYTRTFMSGYTFWDFLKFQKWIFFYQGSKLIYPFSSLRLLLFNQWQTWWAGDKVVSAVDWSILWPVSTIATVTLGFWTLVRKTSANRMVTLLLIWAVVYQSFLCLGVVSSRFFLPVLPVQYILLTYGAVLIWRSLVTRRS